MIVSYPEQICQCLSKGSWQERNVIVICSRKEQKSLIQHSSNQWLLIKKWICLLYTSSYVQENGRGSSGIKTAPAEWAKDGITEAGRGTGTERAQEIAKRAGAPVYVVKDAILKAQNPTAHALTSSGVVYLSDAIPPEYGTVIGNHELCLLYTSRCV